MHAASMQHPQQRELQKHLPQRRGAPARTFSLVPFAGCVCVRVCVCVWCVCECVTQRQKRDRDRDRADREKDGELLRKELGIRGRDRTLIHFETHQSLYSADY